MEAITKIKLLSAIALTLLFLSSSYAEGDYEEGQGYDSATSEDYEVAPEKPYSGNVPPMDENSEGPDYASDEASSDSESDYSY